MCKMKSIQYLIAVKVTKFEGNQNNTIQAPITQIQRLKRNY